MHCSDICMHSCRPCSITLVSMPKYSALSCATIDECHMLLAQENSSTCVPQEGLSCSLWATCGPRQLWMQPDTKLKTLRLGVGGLFCFVFYNCFVIPVPSSQEWTLWMTTSCPDVTKYKPMYIPTIYRFGWLQFYHDVWPPALSSKQRQSNWYQKASLSLGSERPWLPIMLPYHEEQ